MTRLRLGIAAVLALVYALPLFVPPLLERVGVPTAPDAWLLGRIFPGVPAVWVGLRLAALAAAAVLVAWGGWPALAGDGEGGAGEAEAGRGPEGATRTVGLVALGLAALHVAAAPFAARLGPAGQCAYLAWLALPALVLAWSEGVWRVPSSAGLPAALPTAAVVLVWIACRITTDLGTPRTADMIDAWRGFVDTFRFATEGKNLLTDLYDPKLPGVGGILLLLHGIPLFQSGLVDFSFRATQMSQIVWVATTALGVALLAHVLVGRRTAALAAAVFLFAPYTRFVTIFPAPFLAGPLYAVVVALAALLAVRRRSNAGLAALGAAGGVALGYPGVVPILGVVVLWTLWRLRAVLRAHAIGIATGLLSFAAAVIPALANVLTPRSMGAHFRWDGLITIIDAGLLGQLSLRDTPPAWQGVAQRPLDVVVSALLAPFANARVGIRLWGDVLFDPVGTVLLAIGIAACVGALRGSWLARALVLTFVVVLAPAFISPVDVANVPYAVVLPVIAALGAAVGLAALGAAVGPAALGAAVGPAALGAAVGPAALGAAVGPAVLGTTVGSATPAAGASGRLAMGLTIAVVIGGSLLFDVVNPRVLPGSAFGLMFEVLDAPGRARALALAYGPGFVRPTKTLFTGPLVTFTAPTPVGYLEYDAGDLPAAELAGEGKELLFWSHGYDLDVPVTAEICRQWPDATLYEIWDRARLGRVHAARVGGAAWEPAIARGRWRMWSCRDPRRP